VVSYRKEKKLPINDLMQGLLDANLSTRDLMAEAVVFFIAGHETTATTLEFTLYSLATNPDVEKKVMQEIDDELQGSPPTVDNIHKLKYLDCVMDESMRLYPTATFVTRVAKSYYTLPTGVVIPAGTNVVLPIWALHHNEAFWPQPQKFDPERFSDENRTKIVPGSFFPFGQGPRMCIGWKFSLTELKVALASLYQKFTFTVDPSQPLTYSKEFILLKPKNLMFNIHYRKIEKK